MFGNKKIAELTEDLNQAKKDYTVLLDSLDDYNSIKENGMDAIVTYDYKSLISFEEHHIKVATTLKSDKVGLGYCIELYKNEKLVKTFIVYRGQDEVMTSPLSNKRRVLNYELTHSIAQYVVSQLHMYVERMGSSCKIELVDNMPENFKKLFELVD
jgi:hypothetical protein